MPVSFSFRRAVIKTFHDTKPDLPLHIKMLLQLHELEYRSADVERREEMRQEANCGRYNLRRGALFSRLRQQYLPDINTKQLAVCQFRG